MIADTRAVSQNAIVSHSIFTEKFRHTGDKYPRILEMPTFGHSQNHALIQMADLVCSGLVFPLATHVYCTGHVHSVHVNPRYVELRKAFADRLEKLQYRYQYLPTKWTGGLSTTNKLSRLPPRCLFQPP